MKDRFLKIRLSGEDETSIRDRATQAGLSVSEYVRRISIEGRVEQVVSQKEVAYELRRIGAMLKALYPKNANWTNEEKRRWWAEMNTILEAANARESHQAPE